MNTELIDVLKQLLETMEGIRRSVSAISMLIEDGHCRAHVEMVSQSVNNRRGK